MIWVESAYLDHQKTYDDLPLREKISLSFVSQGISLAISGQETTAGIASTFAGYVYKAQYGYEYKSALTTVTLIFEVPISREKFSLLIFLPLLWY